MYISICTSCNWTNKCDFCTLSYLLLWLQRSSAVTWSNYSTKTKLWVSFWTAMFAYAKIQVDCTVRMTFNISIICTTRITFGFVAEKMQKTKINSELFPELYFVNPFPPKKLAEKILNSIRFWMNFLFNVSSARKPKVIQIHT